MTPLLAFLLQPKPVEFSQAQAAGVPCTIVSVNLADPHVKISVAVPYGFPGTDEPFSSIIKRTQPLAAINGAYFSKDTLNPIGDIVIDGKVRYNGRMGTAFMLTSDRKPKMQRVIRHKTYAWGAYETVLECGPALMLDGKVDVDWQSEGFRDPHVTGRTSRMALGYTKEGILKLVYMKKAVSFEDEAKVMQSLGCFEAMNLDAGASLGMYYSGKFVVSPGRKLTNVLGVWVTK